MLLKPLQDSLQQINTVLGSIARLDREESQQVYVGARIGNHVRHVLDHFYALLQLADSHTVDYNVRSRDSLTETDIGFAQAQIDEILVKLDNMEFDDRVVECVSEIDVAESKSASFPSTASREGLWVLNHTIHHVALIKVLAEQRGILLSEQIGLAPATATYQRANA